MHCHEFINEMNRLLDERDNRQHELHEHMHACRECRCAWSLFQQCEKALAGRSSFEMNRTPDERLSECALQQTELRPQIHRYRKWTTRARHPTVIVAGLLALVCAISFTSFQPKSTVSPIVDSSAGTINHDGTAKDASGTNAIALVEDTPNDSHPWYAVADLFTVYELWNRSSDGTDSSVAASVSSSIRPVTASMGSAFKVIRQNVLPTARTPDIDNEQAGHRPSAVSIA